MFVWKAATADCGINIVIPPPHANQPSATTIPIHQPASGSSARSYRNLIKWEASRATEDAASQTASDVAADANVFLKCEPDALMSF